MNIFLFLIIEIILFFIGFHFGFKASRKYQEHLMKKQLLILTQKFIKQQKHEKNT